MGSPVVFSVTTESAPVMQKAWEILEREQPIFCNRCSSHALNLICGGSDAFGEGPLVFLDACAARRASANCVVE
ncbi:hypothetical protein PHMEG_0008071 [Phytophthora megakarya]|uniref:DUF659 domain-containing protein n=1 Tax=Phytophthora megakarya TaxID=4795 RepID=A0A225WLM7_9STRA|nr:hypothetical protein PHMEG_0008071 [Phytophthora megakarya]